MREPPKNGPPHPPTPVFVSSSSCTTPNRMLNSHNKQPPPTPPAHSTRATASRLSRPNDGCCSWRAGTKAIREYLTSNTRYATIETQQSVRGLLILGDELPAPSFQRTPLLICFSENTYYLGYTATNSFGIACSVCRAGDLRTVQHVPQRHIYIHSRW